MNEKLRVDLKTHKQKTHIEIDPKYIDIAKAFLKEEFNMELQIPIWVNYDMEDSLGRFAVVADTHEAVFIDLADYLMEYGTERQIINTLKHECTHYALHQLGEEYTDGSYHFESTLERLDVGTSGAEHITRPRTFYLYHCPNGHSQRPSKVLHGGKRCDSCGEVTAFIEKMCIVI